MDDAANFRAAKRVSKADAVSVQAAETAANAVSLFPKLHTLVIGPVSIPVRGSIIRIWGINLMSTHVMRCRV